MKSSNFFDKKMKKSNPSEQMHDQRLRELPDGIGISNFCYESPIGWIDIIAEGNDLLRTTFSEGPLFDSLSPPAAPVVVEVIERLDRYFAAAPVNFSDIPMQLTHKTDFQEHVWHIIDQIPYGEVRSYLWIAEQMGKPKSVRGVGNAVGANPFSILRPCHRVIRSNGTLGGYGGGLDRKRQLLALEGHDTEKFK